MTQQHDQSAQSGDVQPVGHAASLKFIRAWREWRAECSCGWIGSYYLGKREAEAEIARHLHGS